MTSGANGRKTFRLILIKPSHYDDDGYVIQWLRSPIPANSLACLYGLAIDCAERATCSAPDVALEVVAIDETNQRIRPESIARDIARGRRRAWSCSSACSRTSFRARSTSRRALRKRGRHRRHRRLPRLRHARHAARRSSPNVQKALDLGASCSPARRRKAGSSRCSSDAADGRLKPIYNFMADLPGIEHVPIAASAGRGRPAHLRRERQLRRRPRLPVPVLVLHHHQRAGAQVAPPLGRTTSSGSCATTCAQGIRRFFITDDNFARNKDWEPIFDRLIELREVEKMHDLASSSRSTRSATGCRTSSRRRRAPACSASSSGSRTSAPTTSPRRRRSRTRSPSTARCCSPGRTPRVITYCGYILGFPNDTPERIHRDIEVIAARAADRPARVLLPHPPARLGGPQEAPREGGLDGPGPQQIRPEPRGDRPSADVAGRVGGAPTGAPGRPTIPTSTSSASCAAPSRRRTASARLLFVLNWFIGSIRIEKHPPARMRLRAPEIPPRPAERACRSSRR